MNRSQLNSSQLNAVAGGRAMAVLTSTYAARVAPALLVTSWSTAASVRRMLSTGWATAQRARRVLSAAWGEAVPIRSILAAIYAADQPARAVLQGTYALAGVVECTTPTATLTAGEVSWPIEDVELTQIASSPLWSAGMTVLADDPPEVGQDVTLSIGGQEWALVVTDTDAQRNDPVDGGWSVRAASACSALADVLAADRMPHGGNASAVCAALCDPWPVYWSAPDFYIAPPALQSLAGASCLDAASRIASLVGTMLCQPSGELVVIPRTSGIVHAPHAVEASLTTQRQGGGIRLSPWGISDAVGVSGDGRTRTAVVTVSPGRAVDLLVTDGDVGAPELTSDELTETVAMADGVAELSRPVSSLVRAVTGSGAPIPLAVWPGQRLVWAGSPTHSPVTITYQTTFFSLPVTLPVGTQATHVLVEDGDE